MLVIFQNNLPYNLISGTPFKVDDKVIGLVCAVNDKNFAVDISDECIHFNLYNGALITSISF